MIIKFYEIAGGYPGLERRKSRNENKKPTAAPSKNHRPRQIYQHHYPPLPPPLLEVFIGAKSDGRGEQEENVHNPRFAYAKCQPANLRKSAE